MGIARGFTGARVVAIGVIGLIAFGLGYLSLPAAPDLAVPEGAAPGSLTLTPCSYDTEAGSLPADCGTLVVPENRRNPGSRLIALPVIRIRATGTSPAEPVFRLGGGPGATNLKFPTASRLTRDHDVVLVGYRGVDGSSTLDCPEVTSALQRSADFAAEESFRRYADAFAACARRLPEDGVDLDGYSLPQRVDDLEAARTALGYGKIDLISESAGTRTAMIYSWRHPESLHRSAMIAVNPPGHFLWNPRITDDQLRQYAELCRKDDGCSARTGDLVSTMDSTADDMPARWWFLPIKEGTVRAATLWGLHHATEAAAPLNAPAMLDAWLAAHEGDPSGFWALSTFADLVFPSSFVWGEFAASGMIDAAAAADYYASGGDHGSILGNAASDFLWGGGRLTTVWPESPDYRDYRAVRPSAVETLLVSGSIDFSTPAQTATTELLPALPNGHQVILDGLGHTADFWSYQPDAGQALLTTFFERGTVDGSRYTPREMEFRPALTMSGIATILLGVLIGLVVLALALLAWLARRAARGGFGPKASVWLRTLAPVVLGLGAWSLAVLVVPSLWPGVFLADELVVVLSMGPAVGFGVYLAWVHRDRTPGTRRAGPAAALAGSLAGAWLGFQAVDGIAAVLTTLIGSATAANLALLLLDLGRERDPAYNANS
jgi:pimeloyl-ACP methyl ester carboxylesterase